MGKEYSKEVKDRNIFIGLMLFLLTFIRGSFIFNYKNESTVYTIISVELIVIVFVLIYLKKNNEINIKKIFDIPNIKYIIFGTMAMFIIGRTTTYMIKEVYGYKILQELMNSEIYVNYKGIGLVEFYIYTLIFCPICEEFEFRYVLMNSIGKNSKLSLIINSILFALMHVSYNLIQRFMYFFMGFVLSFSYYRTEKIETSIIIYILNNALSGV